MLTSCFVSKEYIDVVEKTLTNSTKLKKQLAEWYRIDLEEVDKRIKNVILPDFRDNIKNKIIVMD